jgi:hypothetical protein
MFRCCQTSGGLDFGLSRHISFFWDYFPLPQNIAMKPVNHSYPVHGRGWLRCSAALLLAGLTATTVTQADVRQGLVSYWPLDEVVTLPDGFSLGTPDVVSGNHMNMTLEDFTGTMSAANLVSGRHGQAMSFDAINQNYMVHRTPVGADTGLPISRASSFSVLMWIKSVGEGQADLRFFSEGSTTSGNPLFALGTQTAEPNGRIKLFIRDRNGAVQVNTHSEAVALDGTWQHIAWVETNGQATLYVDGEEDSTFTYSPNPALRADEITSLGGILRATASHWFTGELDEVGVWERALSQEEVQDVMENRVAFPVPAFAPVFSADPIGNDSLWIGDSIVLSASVTGTRPLSFQWKLDGEDVPGATSPTLELTNGSAALSGDYTLVVTNDAGSETSSVARVEFNPAPAPDLLEGMVAYWPLDELEGTKTPDIARGYDLEAVNLSQADVVPGRWGNAIRMEFSRQTLLQRIHEPGDLLPIYQHPNFTISLWVNGPANQADLRIFSEGSNANSTPLFNIGTHSGGADGRLDSFIRSDTGGGATHIYSEGVAFDDTWHHVVYVQREVGGAMVARFFIDGVEDPAVLQPIRPLTLNITTVGGILRGTPSHWFNGLIDDVAVWNRALSPDEIELLFTDGTPEPPPIQQPLNVRLFSAEFPAVKKGDTVALRWDVNRDASLSISPILGNVDDQTEVGLGRADVTLEETTTFTLTLTRGEETFTAQTTVFVIDDVANGWSVLDTFDRYPTGALRDTPWWVDLRTPGGQIVEQDGNHLLRIVGVDAASLLPLRRYTIREGQSATVFFRIYVPENLATNWRQNFGVTEKNLRWHGDSTGNVGPMISAFTATGVLDFEAIFGIGGAPLQGFSNIESNTILNAWLDIRNEPAAGGLGDVFSFHIQRPGDVTRTTLFADYQSDRDPAGSIDLGPKLPNLDKLFVTNTNGENSLLFDDFYISTTGFLNTVPRAPGFAAIVGDPVGPEPSAAVILLQPGGELEISWTEGVLESAGSIDGPWTPVDGATSPHSVAAEGSARYFRIQ